jgi:hypothetical protein
MKSADKIQQSVQHTTTVSAMRVIAEASFKKKWRNNCHYGWMTSKKKKTVR